MLEDKHAWLSIVLFSVIARVALAPFTGHPYDMSIWMETGRYVAEGRSPYELNIHLGYPPLWGFWCGLSYVLSNSILPGNLFAYILAIKIPIVTADLVISWMLVGLPRTFEIRAASSNNTSSKDLTVRRSLAAFFLLNPYVLTVGVVWGMMDNVAALLVVLVALALILEKDIAAGVALGLAIALKLYPVLFLFAVIPYLATRNRGGARALSFFIALALTQLVSIVGPFLLFGWDAAGFVGVLVDQTSRSPGGISPIGILSLLMNLGVQNLGPFDLQSLSQLTVLRLIWIPAVCLSAIFIARAGLQSSFAGTVRAFAFVYAVWLLTAPWVSEQNVETLLIFMLFEGAFSGFGRFQKWSYAIASCIVLTFAFFYVPATSFVFPVYSIEAAPMRVLGKYVLPWISLAFASYVVIETIRIALVIKSGSRPRDNRMRNAPTVLLL